MSPCLPDLLPTKSENSDRRFERLVRLLLETSAIGTETSRRDIRVAAERIVMQTARRCRRGGSGPEGRCAQPDAPSELTGRWTRSWQWLRGARHRRAAK